MRFTEEHRAAIRAFQKSINEPETGLFKRNSVTHRKLSEAARRALRNLPKQPRARLTFDGAALKWHGGRLNGKSWKAVSGARGYQKKEFQYVADKGPIPEGHLYLVEMSLIAVEVFVVLGVFVLRNPWIVWSARGLVGQFWLVELSLRMVWGLWLP